jgi:hypothetical protein
MNLGWFRIFRRKPRRKRLELRLVTYAEGDRLIRESNGAWSIAWEEDKALNRVVARLTGWEQVGCGWWRHPCGGETPGVPNCLTFDYLFALQLQLTVAELAEYLPVVERYSKEQLPEIWREINPSYVIDFALVVANEKHRARAFVRISSFLGIKPTDEGARQQLTESGGKGKE